jgi:hypothetical protein
MKEEDKNKPPEQKTTSTQKDSNSNSGRENIEPLKKETLEDRAERENWTDVAESHLGIDE